VAENKGHCGFCVWLLMCILFAGGTTCAFLPCAKHDFKSDRLSAKTYGTRMDALMNNALRSLIFLLSACCILACGEKLDQPKLEALATCTSTQSITYTNHIKTILDGRCISCHSTSLSGTDRVGATAAYDYDTFAAATASVGGEDVAQRANTRAQEGTMPPTGSLPAAELNCLQLWIDQGTQE
jgi:cytochrome c5